MGQPSRCCLPIKPVLYKWVNIVTSKLHKRKEKKNLRKKSRCISHKSFAGSNATSCPYNYIQV
ncbi:hypothetical protein HanXRQr2_Chr11g0495451 [Helianthus annuus]|uniref:Uncharacterized protein n=1 Tax=Helianthus annuus TaxID=4232 RepID=A0A9K3HQD7_HELAN|nr:hypothetical protein HanXRQr2_Chr11g0495451 [Helianthus annuus]